MSFMVGEGMDEILTLEIGGGAGNGSDVYPSICTCQVR